MTQASTGVGLLALVLAFTSVAETRAQDAPAPSPAPRLTPRLRPRPVAPQAPAPAAPATPTQAAPRPTSPAQEVQPPARASAPTSAAPQNQATSTTLLPSNFYPPVLPVYKNLDPPPGYVEVRSFNRSLLWSGGVVLVLSYGVSVGYAAAHSEDKGMGAMAVPILGPWLALGQRKFSCDIDTGIPTSVDGIDNIEQSAEEAQACWANQVKVGAIMTGLGVGQLVGTLMVTAGLLDQKRTWVRADLGPVSLRIDPLAGPGMSGLVTSGSF